MDKKQIEYNGLKFNRDDKTGYYLSTTNVNGKRKRLHRYVWECNYGEIPKGYYIHHIDENKGNNSIENLELIKAGRHSKLHSTELATDEFKKKRKKNIKENALPKAIEWHKSEEGRAWHREHYKKGLGQMEKETFQCDYCGKEFQSISMGRNRFCSNKCKSAWRRKSGIDDEERICVICNNKFITNKYSKAKTCSGRCSGEYRKKSKASKNK